MNITPVVNWIAMISELRNSQYRMTRADIARECGVGRTTVLSYLQGSTPRHDDGEQLISLWMRITTKPRHMLPTEIPPLSAASMRSR